MPTPLASKFLNFLNYLNYLLLITFGPLNNQTSSPPRSMIYFHRQNRNVNLTVAKESAVKTRTHAGHITVSSHAVDAPF